MFIFSVPGCVLLTLYCSSDHEVFPHDIVPLEPSLSCQLMRDFSGEKEGFLRVGREGWLLPSHYATQAHGYYNMPLRSDDVWIATFPRSGLLPDTFSSVSHLFSINLPHSISLYSLYSFTGLKSYF